MPARLRLADPVELAEALGRFASGERAPADLRLLTKHYLAALETRAPGRSVEVRVPPYAAVQCVEGVRHTRGTPPAVVDRPRHGRARLARRRALRGAPAHRRATAGPPRSPAAAAGMRRIG